LEKSLSKKDESLFKEQVEKLCGTVAEKAVEIIIRIPQD
jgi:hypothetical protein